MPVAFGLDLGTTSLAAVAVNEAGQVIATRVRKNDAGVPTARGHFEQTPRRLLQLAQEVLRELVTAIDDEPMCLGITGQMHGVLLVDADRIPVSNLITWQDRRALEFAGTSDETWLERLHASCNAEDVFATGTRPAPGYLGTTLFVLNRQNQLPSQFSRAVMIADWIAAELSDGNIVTDPTNAASSGVFDVRQSQWSEGLLTSLGINRQWLPDVERSGVNIGTLCRRAAMETGLPAGLPIGNAIGDNQASVIGAGGATTATLQINIGTGGQINWSGDSFTRIDGMDTRPLPHDRFLMVGAGTVGGAAYAWVADFIRNLLREFNSNVSRDEVYARLAELADSVPASEPELVCEPFFFGTRQEPDRRGAFREISAENFSAGRIAAAVLVGIAEALHQFLKRAGERAPQNVERIIGTGNGLRENPLLVKLISDRFQLPVQMPEYREEAAVGAALLAASQCAG